MLTLYEFGPPPPSRSLSDTRGWLTGARPMGAPSSIDRGKPAMIRRIREWLLSLTSMFVALVVLSSLLIASYELDTWPWADRRPLRERSEFGTVRRTTLAPIQSAPGRVDSSRRTVIRCELENLAGSGSTSGGSSTLIWM